MEFKSQFDHVIDESNSIAITTHRNPDLDAISTLLAIGFYIQRAHPEKNFRLVIEDTQNLEFSNILGIENVEWLGDISSDLSKVDLAIFCDGNKFSRFTLNETNLNFKGTTVCIDHHEKENFEYDLELILDKKAATAQIVAETLFDDVKLLTQEIAEVLMIGIMGDTGGLTYIGKSNSEVLALVQKLINTFDINLKRLQDDRIKMDADRFIIFQELVKNTKLRTFSDKPNLSYTWLNRELIESLPDDAIKGDRYRQSIMSRISDYPWGFFVRFNPDDPLAYKISFRSGENGPNVRLITEDHFDGGGHDKSAAGFFRLEFEDQYSAEEIAKKIVKILEKIKAE